MQVAKHGWFLAHARAVTAYFCSTAWGSVGNPRGLRVLATSCPELLDLNSTCSAATCSEDSEMAGDWGEVFQLL